MDGRAAGRGQIPNHPFSVVSVNSVVNPLNPHLEIRIPQSDAFAFHPIDGLAQSVLDADLRLEAGHFLQVREVVHAVAREGRRLRVLLAEDRERDRGAA